MEFLLSVDKKLCWENKIGMAYFFELGYLIVVLMRSM